MALRNLGSRWERCIFFSGLVTSLISTCFLIQAVDDLADDHLGIDPRTFGMLLVAGAAFAVAWFCIYELKRGRSLPAVRWCLREHVAAVPALRSPATLFLLTFAAIVIVAAIAHLGEIGLTTMLARSDVVVSLITAVVLATAAAAGAHIVLRVAPEVVRFIATLLAPPIRLSPLVFSFDAETTAMRAFAAWSPPLFSRPPPLPI